MGTSRKGITFLLTGSTSGIGRETARALGAAGASLFIHGRDRAKVEALKAELAGSGAPVGTFVADLASLEQVARLAAEVAGSVDSLDVLINNAGVGTAVQAKTRELSADGQELRFAVNYLAAFLLTEELLKRGLPRKAVINVASAGQEDLDFSDLMTEGGYSGARVYCRSKLAMIMMSLDLAESHPRLRSNALHPGTYLDTSMVRRAGIQPLGPASRGAQSILAVISAALDGGTTGTYFNESRPSRALAQAYDPAARRRLREASLALVAPYRSRAARDGRGGQDRAERH
ncbi:MAG TPA: SDR family NAD(P)-dependent oxidoreductase [Spirochaetia bacterium]|nr:SDR family NAD(P)-dependent oxidoreductase [Spirochaetia bacterium]